MTLKPKKLNILLFAISTIFGFLALASEASATANVYYSVGQSVSNLMTGSPNVTITSGVATFDVAQTGNIGVGDVMIVNAISYYISSKTSTTVWNVTTATGDVPTNISSTAVTSIGRVYTSLSSAEAGAPTLLGTSDLVTDNIQINFPCYYDSGADTTAVTIDGYTTGAINYIKIYTPNNTTTEVNFSQRHNGKWDDGKYRLAIGTANGAVAMEIKEDYVRIEGLQSERTNATSSSWSSVIYVSNTAINTLSDIYISDSILRKGNSTYGVVTATSGKTTIRNSIISEGATMGIMATYDANAPYVSVENCTVINNGTYGVQRYGSIAGLIVKNTYSGDNSSGDYDGVTSMTTSASSDTTGSAGLQSIALSTANFTSLASGQEDYHLTDSSALQNVGTDLSGTFNTDIDGASRNASINAWDIGADETATQIYRSVGPGATAILESDSSHARTVTLTSGTATFSVALADNIGVGDAVLIDTGGTNDAIDASDALLFIHGRTSSTVYTLRTHTGATPADIASNNTYQIYRAHTSLFDAEAGTKNTSIPITFNGGNRDLVANNEEWNVACYANGTTADTVNMAILGWTTSAQNYIKIYTPTDLSEVGISQRHSGKWDDNKYSLKSSTIVLASYSPYVQIYGLQLEVQGTAQYKYGIIIQGGYLKGIYVGYNIVRNTGSAADRIGIGSAAAVGNESAYIFNNVVYGFSDANNVGIEVNPEPGYSSFIYNNTVYGCNVGYHSGNSTTNAKNNIAQNCTNGFNGTFAAGSDYNISNIANDAPSPSYRTNLATDVAFVDEAGDDFHLSYTDTAARNAGTSLASDSALPFNTDIDGASRNASINAWDIGADETATQIYRSVGPGATAILESDSSHARTVTLTSGTATFSVALADNIGVGDAVLIDSSNDNSITSADTLLFISGRNSSTSYTLKTHTGGTPSNITVNDTYQIYRAYTSLSLAEAGTKNTSIPISFNGGDRDLVTNNEEWNIACYANGTTADTTAVTIAGWITAQQNFIKIYTPVSATEVGVSQRHSGKWDDGKYNIKTSSGYPVYSSSIANIEISGLEIMTTASSGYVTGIRGVMYPYSGSNIKIHDNIITAQNYNNSFDQFNGIQVYNIAAGITMGSIYNNIIYNFNSSNNIGTGFHDQLSIGMDYNNTVYNCDTGINVGTFSTKYVKNNIVQNTITGYVGTADASSTNNISDHDDAPGLNPKNSTTVSFVDATNKDFHLAQSDTAARQSGANLTDDASLPITTDIDGQLRNPSGAGWDIGADEGTVEFTPTVMQSGGDYSTLSSWEAGVQTDLTATTTRVFSHSGKTGTIADNTTVTGQTSGAIATVVHASANQILLEITSGTFVSGETVQVTTNNSVVISDNGNPASAVAKIDGAWTVADTTAVDIDGWNTGADNYIRVYTTATARHQGKWDDGKYNINVSTTGVSTFRINNPYVKIVGLQIINSGDYSMGMYLVANNSVIDSCIIKAGGIPANSIAGVSSATYINNFVINSLIYGYKNGTNTSFQAVTVSSGQLNVYNTTVANSHYGFYQAYQNIKAVNTISYNNDIGHNISLSSYMTGTDYNISSDATAPGNNSKINTTVQFIDATNKDFHLASTDTAAKDFGTSLASDSAFPFNTDIDGQTRIGAWDIGVDEAPTQIFRSVGPSATAVLESDTAHARNVTVASGVATFSVALAENIGVGDAVLIDTGGTNDAIDASDTLLFIHGRTSSTVYTLRTHTGATPADITSNNTYQIYRAYTSLSNAEAGTKNTSIPITFNGGDRDLVINNEEWNIACYANGTTADTTAVAVDGWNTSAQNFIKVYTPVYTNEVGVSQRHSGKWDDSKYQLNTADPFGGSLWLTSGYTVLDGIQIKYTAQMSYGNIGVISINDNTNGIKIKNSIITSIDAYDNDIRGIRMGDGLAGVHYINNNIIYGSGLDEGIQILYTGTFYIYNNTIDGVATGIHRNSGTIVAKNNITQNCTDGFNGSFDATSDYNISDLADDAPGANSKNSTTVSFIDAANKDFHLSPTDTAAKNSGIDLSADVNLRFANDIDGSSRNASINAFDIGADETATQIFRSVGPSASSALATDSSHANTVTLTSGVATFSAALSDGIGVGDAVLIDTGGTNDAIDASDTLLFIHGRTSSTVYTLRTHTGATPTDIASNNTYQVYRAYTSLSNAEAGTKNTSIPITFNGGNRDLVTNNEEWNIACYANGTTADTVGVGIDGWNTGEQNYIKIYTPVYTNEIGVSQRHGGEWDSNKYKMEFPIFNFISVGEEYVRIDGIQISSGNYGQNVSSLKFSFMGGVLNSDCRFSNSIIKDSDGRAIEILGGSVKIWNNILYNSTADGILSTYALTAPSVLIYNNTISGYNNGIWANGGVTIAKNNIVQNSTTNYSGTFDVSSANNISGDATSPNSGATDCGGHSCRNQTVNFVDATNKDFHLAQSDTAARGAGANLTADASFPFSTDIDGQVRNPSGAGWDIGADEGTVEFTPTVMQSGGDYSTLSSWESGVQTDLTATTTRVFSHGGITGTIADNATVTGQTSSATATVVHATTNQILLETISGTFASGETVQVTTDNSVVISDNGNPASAVAKIDGAWTVADGALDIDGWITGADNYIKVYTASAARHQGKWDDMKYRMVAGTGYNTTISCSNVVFDGVQINRSYVGTGEFSGLAIAPKLYNLLVSNNIIKHTGQVSASNGIRASSNPNYDVRIINNVIYGFTNGVFLYNSGYVHPQSFIYNNTVTYCDVCYYMSASGLPLVFAKNNIAQNCATGYSGAFDTLSSNNISPDATAPGTNSKINTTVNFVSTTAGAEDFHLAENDVAARDFGVDLSADSNLAFNTDIDGNLRSSVPSPQGSGIWDIGADEAATRIFRSVGPSATGLLASDSSHANTVTVTGGIAVFAEAMPSQVGVGDAVLIDTGGTNDAIDTSDTLLFIHSRTSSTVYTLRTHTGAIPSDIPVNDTYQIYRAYTSLSNAEAGTKNTSIPITFNGGNRDLVANNEEWNIACYANGVTADATSVVIDGWNNSSKNYLKIYTPVELNEVGVSQRHRGVWDDNKYKHEISTANQNLLVQDSNIKIEGLQIKTTTATYQYSYGIWLSLSAGSGEEASYISSNIVRDGYPDGGASHVGIILGNIDGVYRVYNNLVYNFKTSDSSHGNGIQTNASATATYVYNNTVVNSFHGFHAYGGSVDYLKNNIAQNCVDGFYGSPNSASNYNISDLASDAPGANSKNLTEVKFLNESAYDFHLASTDTAAKNAGTSLASDSALPFNTDIDGKVRPTGEAWDIGADETTDAETVRMKGDIQMKGNVKFK